MLEPLTQLTAAFEEVIKDESCEYFGYLLAHFGGWPTPFYAETLSKPYGADVYFKDKDLRHGDTHKRNNTLGQALLAKYVGKERLIAETGAG